jgi:transcriptional regulator with GAF, ATPase, and Fis domain
VFAVNSRAGVARSIDAEDVVRVLSEIARVASGTLDLPEIFDRVAPAIRRVIPFDNWGVVRIIDDERAVNHAGTIPRHSDPIPLNSWSPRIRPRPGPCPRVEDARVECDPTFPIDAKSLEWGLQSSIWEPFPSSETLQGGVWLGSRQPHAFTDDHQNMMAPIAALLATAIEHWLIWDAERRQRERLEAVESLLGTITVSLDVHEVLEQLFAVAQPIVPHHMSAVTQIDLQAGTTHVIASAAERDIQVPTRPFPLTETELAERLEFGLMRDIPAEMKPDTERTRMILSVGLRSMIRVPLLLSGEVRGTLSFLHREPSRYDRQDAEVVRRLADRIALVIAHRRLAEEARIAEETRARAERLEARVETLARELEAHGMGRMVGVSRSWKETLGQVGRVAPSDTTVLITGESGTGKEVIASLIHRGSPRSGKPFVAINCAALPEQLLESELFGHEKGAFTGAIATKIGRVEQAEGGTLFLDEIAEMSPLLQAKLLRVLEQREFQRVGGTRTLRADARVIAATNRDLAASIARGAFREDLYYRLNVFAIPIAALRERPADIMPLAEAFLEDLGRTMGRPAAGISRDAREWLVSLQWPGNVRELRNAIERAILLCDGGLITREHLPAPMARLDGIPMGSRASGGPAPGTPESVDLPTAERGLIERALSQSNGNKSRAARLLGLTRAQLYTRMEKHRIR